MRVNAVQTFCWYAVTLLVGGLFIYYAGIAAWFVEHYGDAVTLYIVGFIAFVFLAVFFVFGASGATLIHRENVSLRELERKMTARDANIHEIAHAVMNDAYDAPPILRETFRVLARFVRRKSDRSVDTELLRDFYETELTRSIHSLEQYRVLLFTLGILGTFFGVVYALQLGDIPTTASEIQQFSFAIMQRIGICFTSSLIAMAGAVILQQLGKRYENFTVGMVPKMMILLEDILLNVHSDLYRKHVRDQIMEVAS